MAELGNATHLHLVEYLKVHGVQVPDGKVVQPALQGIERGGDGEFPSVTAEDGVVNLLEDDSGGGGGGEGARDVIDGEADGDCELEELV